MKNLLFIAAVIAFASLSICELSAEIISSKTPIEVPELTPDELLGAEESIAAEEENFGTSVPEPTAFALIALGLGVGGGLMVRRKT